MALPATAWCHGVRSKPDTEQTRHAKWASEGAKKGVWRTDQDLALGHLSVLRVSNPLHYRSASRPFEYVSTSIFSSNLVRGDGIAPPQAEANRVTAGPHCCSGTHT